MSHSKKDNKPIETFSEKDLMAYLLEKKKPYNNFLKNAQRTKGIYGKIKKMMYEQNGTINKRYKA